MKKRCVWVMGVVLICLLCACSNGQSDVDTLPMEGSQSGTQFDQSLRLTNTNGEKAVFKVKNTGTVNVNVKINGDDTTAIMLTPEEEGEISVTLTNKSAQYNFKVVPTPNGGDISIDYSISQE